MPRGNVRVSITADTTGLERGTKKAEADLKSFSAAGAGHLKKLAGAAAGAAAAYIGIGEAKAAIKTTEDLGRATITLHKSLGLSVKAASEWAAVARVRNIDAKQLTQSFAILSKNAVAVSGAHDKQRTALNQLGTSTTDVQKKAALLAKGLGPQADAFKKLGLSTRDVESANKDFNGFLGKVADGFGHLRAGTDKTALGMKLFGKGWQTVLPILRDGSKAMDDQLKLAEKYGVTFNGHTIKSVKDLIAAQREAKFATLGLQVAFGTTLAPQLTKVIPAFAHFVAGVREGTGAGGKFVDIMRQVGRSFGAIFTVAKHATDGALGFFSSLIRGEGAVAGLVGKLIPGNDKFDVFAKRAGAAADKIDRFREKLRPTLPSVQSLSDKIDHANRSLSSFHTQVEKMRFDGLRAELDKLNADLRTTASNALLNSLADPGGGVKPFTGLTTPHGKKLKKKAGGGRIPGARTAADTVPALLSPQEFVVTGGGERILENMTFPGVLNWLQGAQPSHFAGGGRVIGPSAVSRMQSFADSMAAKNLPYTYGGGHSGFSPSPGYDCSGFVSAILHAGGILGTPMAVRQPLQSQLLPGPGKFVTVGIRGSSGKSAHTMIKVGNAFYESGGGGNGAHRRGGWNGAFDLFHPAGEATKADATGSGQLPGAGSGGSQTAHDERISSQREADAGVSPFEQASAAADLGIASADAGPASVKVGGVGGRTVSRDVAKLGALRTKQKVLGARIRQLRKALKGKLRPSTRLRLTQELAGLLPEHTDLGNQVQALLRPAADTSSSDVGGGAAGDAGGGGDPNQPLIDAINAAADQQREHDELIKQQIALQETIRDEQRKFNNVGTSNYATLAKAIADVASGQLGGKIGLGFMSPAFAGGMARY